MPDTKFYLEYIRPLGNMSDNLTKLVLSGETVCQVTGFTINTPDKIFTWTLTSPISSANYLGPRLQNTMKIRNVYAYVSSSTNVAFNIYYGAVGSTTTLLSSDLTATTSENSTTSFTTTTLSAGTWLRLHISSVSGYPGQLVVSIALY